MAGGRKKGAEYAHEHGVKCHLTLNVFAHNEDIVPFRQYLESIRHIPIDAFIVSDPGIIEIVNQMIPGGGAASLDTGQFY